VSDKKPYARIVTAMGTADVYDHGSCDHDYACDCEFPIEVVPHFPCEESEVRRFEGAIFHGQGCGAWKNGEWKFERIDQEEPHAT